MLYNEVKIYGERNSGTNLLRKIIEENFHCKLLHDQAPSFFMQKVLKAGLWEELSRLDKNIHLESIADEEAVSYNALDRNLGWKHALPPIEILRKYQNIKRLLILVNVKNPYEWIKSFYKKPYHRVITEPKGSFSEFIRHYWVTVQRDNLQIDDKILSNPVELYVKKHQGYIELCEEFKDNLLLIKYEDVLQEFDKFCENLSAKIPPKDIGKWTIPQKPVKKGVEQNFEQYREKYAKSFPHEGISQDDLDFINEWVPDTIFEFFGYSRYVNAVQED